MKDAELKALVDKYGTVTVKAEDMPPSDLAALNKKLANHD